jgi:tRNA-specific 2-thiouridylase
MVAMSGGVDSSVAALLLMRAGLSICGATLRLDADDASGACCSPDNVEDARRVAGRLGIDHHVFDFSKIFRRKVVDRFVEGYLGGETPNPCVECNRSVKFGPLLSRARLSGCGCIATGHYVRREYDAAAGRWYLRRAADAGKDQSYVLYTLTQDELAHTLFPLGELHKSEVRALAAQSGLASAHRPDSQDICFVPGGDYAAFLERMGVQSPPGRFVGPGGEEIGTHRGIVRYTVGQRRGLGISAPQRLFVIEKNPADNTVRVGAEELLFSRRMLVRDVIWSAIAPPQGPLRAQVRARYRQAAQPAQIFPQPDGGALVEFDAPQRALAPGQAAVFYDGDVVLGGATICPPRDALRQIEKTAAPKGGV